MDGLRFCSFCKCGNDLLLFPSEDGLAHICLPCVKSANRAIRDRSPNTIKANKPTTHIRSECHAHDDLWAIEPWFPANQNGAL